MVIFLYPLVHLTTLPPGEKRLQIFLQCFLHNRATWSS